MTGDGSSGCTLPQSPMGSHVHRSCWFRGTCSPGALRPLWLLHSSASSSSGFPGPWEEGFDGDILFRAEHSKVSCPLHTVRLWVSVLVPICCKRKLLQWWLRKPLIYEYSRMSPWVHLLLCSFHRTVVFGFILGPWDSYTQVLCNQAVLGRGSMSWSKP